MQTGRQAVCIHRATTSTNSAMHIDAMRHKAWKRTHRRDRRTDGNSNWAPEAPHSRITRKVAPAIPERGVVQPGTIKKFLDLLERKLTLSILQVSASLRTHQRSPAGSVPKSRDSLALKAIVQKRPGVLLGNIYGTQPLPLLLGSLGEA